MSFFSRDIIHQVFALIFSDDILLMSNSKPLVPQLHDIANRENCFSFQTKDKGKLFVVFFSFQFLTTNDQKICTTYPKIIEIAFPLTI